MTTSLIFGGGEGLMVVPLQKRAIFYSVLVIIVVVHRGCLVIGSV